MPFSMKLWLVQGQDLLEFKRKVLNDEQQLENWVVKDPSVLGFNILLIGRQVTTGNGGRIDPLAIDRRTLAVSTPIRTSCACSATPQRWTSYGSHSVLGNGSLNGRAKFFSSTRWRRAE
jgi:hypothetical protein